jgi:hypothetical protein
MDEVRDPPVRVGGHLPAPLIRQPLNIYSMRRVVGDVEGVPKIVVGGAPAVPGVTHYPIAVPVPVWPSAV